MRSAGCHAQHDSANSSCDAHSPGMYAVGDGETNTDQVGFSAGNTYHARNDAANAVGQRSGADLRKISRFPFRVGEFLAGVVALEGAALQVGLTINTT